MSILSHSKETKVSVKDVRRLNSIFGKLGWRMHINDETVFSYESIFNNFCDFLACLNSEEKELFFYLTEDFLHCPYTIYPKLMREALLHIPEEIIDKSNDVFLIPLINPREIGKTKSSTGSLYSVLRDVIPKIPKLDNKKPKSYEDPSLLNQRHNKRKKSLILIFDDFIGSGDTAVSALDYFNNEIRLESDVPIVISLVAQYQGLEKIKELDFKVYAARRRNKCISDSTKIENKCRAIKIIRKIENRMGVSKKNRLGYKKSQALVSMIRTPNNTLPIYWWSKKPNGEEWNGIFRR